MTTPDPNRGPTVPVSSELLFVEFILQTRRAVDALVRPIRGHFVAVLSSTALAGILTTGLSFMFRNEYASSVSFFVDRTARRLNLPSGLAGLAQQVGLGDDEAAQPLEFYAWLASSSPVLEATLFDTVPVAVRKKGDDGPTSATAWTQLLDEPQSYDLVAEARAVKRLRDHVRATVNPQTSLVTIAVTAPTPDLAVWAAGQTFAEVNKANTVTRQTRAGNELKFLRDRLEHAGQGLRSSEDALTSFYQRNRKFQDSPVLLFEEERLRRAVEVAREVYLSLSRSTQDAELRAVRDIPALTLIEGPVVPVRKSGPHRLLLGIIGALLGLTLAYAHASLRELGVLDETEGRAA